MGDQTAVLLYVPFSAFQTVEKPKKTTNTTADTRQVNAVLAMIYDDFGVAAKP